MIDGALAAPAVVHLGGHPRIRAHLVVTRYPGWRYLGRVLGRGICWIGASWGTLALTFDPFVASFPFVVGLGYTWRAVRGRYRVHAFSGVCPRCAGELEIRPGSTIDLPHSLVCYGCHHEPELRLEPAGRPRTA